MRSKITRILISMLTLGSVSQCQVVLADDLCIPASVNLTPGSVIAFEGDSLTYGLDWNGKGPPINTSGDKRSPSPFPETLGGLLGSEIGVVNHGFPGDNSSDGLTRWSSSPTTSVTILMYGTNDAGNHGRRLSGSVPPKLYNRNLRKLAYRRLNAGGQVIIMTPPPIEDPASERRLELYRIESRNVAHDLGLLLFETALSLRSIDPKWIDGLHLTEAANIAIAAELRHFLCIKP